MHKNVGFLNAPTNLKRNKKIIHFSTQSFTRYIAVAFACDSDLKNFILYSSD